MNGDRSAIDGRFCPAPGCGGALQYRRALRDGQLLTVRWCWSCGREIEVHRFPYERLPEVEREARAR